MRKARSRLSPRRRFAKSRLARTRFLRNFNPFFPLFMIVVFLMLFLLVFAPAPDLASPAGNKPSRFIIEVKTIEVEEKPHASVKAKVTAYSCGGLTTQAEINMNCPSLRYSENGLTANGTEPVPYKTMACDSANMGKTFNLEGYGAVTCTDTGGAISGAGRFDLYLADVQEARVFGVQYLEYSL